MITPTVVEAPATVIPPADTVRSREPLTPSTTHEEDLHSKAARSINLIWEGTQGLIALCVTATVLYVAGHLALRPAPENTSGFLFLTSLATLVIGFYFGRTNHARDGGVAVSKT